MSDPREPGHPVGPEIDSTQNMTQAAPADSAGSQAGEPAQQGHTSQQRAGDMLRQLQHMIDQVSAQAGPPMREIAAKAAELAAVAAQRAGPLAAKAAEKTQVYGERFAAKSKEMASDLRAKQAAEGGQADATGATGDSEPELSTEAKQEGGL